MVFIIKEIKLVLNLQIL